MNIFRPKYRMVKQRLKAFGEQLKSVKSEARYTAAFWMDRLRRLDDAHTWEYIITAYLARLCTDEGRRFLILSFFEDSSVIWLCNELYISKSVYYNMSERILNDIIGLALEAGLINIMQNIETASVAFDYIDKDKWAKIDELIMKADCGKVGNYHNIVLAVLYVKDNNIPWRELPCEYGNWNTVYKRYMRWRKIGLWNRISEIIG